MFTDPVTGDNFYDRGEQLSLLLKRAYGLEAGYRQNIALLGQETIGKTSLLLQFLSQMQEKKLKVLPIYLEVTHELPFEHLVNRFISIAIFNLIKQCKKITPTQNLEELLEEAKGLIPNTFLEIKRCLSYLKNSQLDSAYSIMLNLPQALSKEIGLPVIVIIEEFQRMQRMPLFGNPFSELAKKIMVSKDVMYIISSSSLTQAQKILSRELTLLFGNFEIITLEPFDIKTSNAFLEKRLNPVKCSEYYRNFISEITDGHPLYLNIVSEEIRSTALEKKSGFVTDNIIISALTKLLFDSAGILNQLFTHRLRELPTNRSPLSHISILLSLAHNCSKVKKIKEYLYTKSEREFLNHLNTMVELGYVYKNGVFYYLNDSLFKLWLRDVYEPKMSSLDLEIETKKEYFKHSLQKRLESFLKSREKSIVEHLRELFTSFGNEIVYWGSRKIKLPSFEYIETNSPSSHLSIVTAKTQNKLWCFVVKRGPLNRNAMEDIETHCERLKLKKGRKFILPLDGIDEDAQLIAKEMKFTILESQELNKILKLYGKHRIFS
ncbi:MAG: hypothetical protein NC898_01820 [Candidatus Omnitrophica bacterium]|nr:hypothetical protein [Candidatus Omnitrophota bacterium]MCM8793190.1 hypothetical protein [Candidatus Omnitrophota bacterium]